MDTHEKTVNIFNEVVANLGIFGKYNMKILLLLFLPITLYSIFFYLFIFTAAVTNYRCKVNECEHRTNSDWVKFAIPETNLGKLEKCSRFAKQDRVPQSVEICSREWFNNQSIVPCDEYIYGEENTISKEFNLACQEWKRTLVGTAHGSGMLMSQILSGALSDRYGRKFVLILCSTLNGITGLIKTFSPNYEAFVTLEFIEGLLSGGIMLNVFTLVMEMATPRGRIISHNLLWGAMNIGQPILVLVAWAFQDWKKSIWTLQIPILLVITYIWLIDESVRWLLINNRDDKAIKILRKIVKFNFKKDETPKSLTSLFQELHHSTNAEEMQPLNPEVKTKEQELRTEMPPIETQAEQKSKKSLILQVFKSPKLRLRVILVIITWIGTSLLLSGLDIYGMQYLPGNKYSNFLILCVADPAVQFASIFAILRYGRKRMMASGYVLTSICCFAVIAVPSTWNGMILSLYTFSKFGICLCYNSMFVMTGEIFPTNLRSTLMGTGITGAKIGLITASQFPLLASYWESLPVLLFGLIALVLSFALIPLPETVNVKLPDTIKEAEDMKI